MPSPNLPSTITLYDLQRFRCARWLYARAHLEADALGERRWGTLTLSRICRDLAAIEDFFAEGLIETARHYQTMTLGQFEDHNAELYKLALRKFGLVAY